MRVLLLSGAIATGKTTVGTELVATREARLLRVREALAGVLGVPPNDRRTLQVKGADLDRRTGGRWLRDYIEEHGEGDGALVVDALRTRRQTLPILDSFVDSRLIFLEAHDETRRSRYSEGALSDPVKASIDFDTAMRHETELEVLRLKPLAHVVIATDDLSAHQVAADIRARLGGA